MFSPTNGFRVDVTRTGLVRCLGSFSLAVISLGGILARATCALPRQTAPKPVYDYRTECSQKPADCLAHITRLTVNLRAYVGRLKPGDPVYLNPQPEPPGKPGPGDPGPGDPLMSYRVLQARLSALKSVDANSAAGPNAQKWSAQLRTVQIALDRLGKSQTQKTAAVAAASLAQALDSLSKLGLAR